MILSKIGIYVLIKYVKDQNFKKVDYQMIFKNYFKFLFFFIPDLNPEFSLDVLFKLN